MIFIDYVFWGWYQILDKTIYSMRNENGGVGPREHSFFITFLLHGINIWSGLRYFLIEYLDKTVGLYGGLFIAVGVFAIGYLLFYKNRRATAVISSDMSFLKASISLLLTVGYTVVTIYLMLETGNHVRYKLHPDLPL